jgi:ribosomal protein S19
VAREVSPDRDSFVHRNLVVVLLFAMIAVIPLLWIFGNTTELNPDRSGPVMTSALCLGLACAIGFSLLIAIVKPASRSSTTVTAIAFFFVGLVMGTLVGMTLVGEAFQLIDFSGPHVGRKVEDFAIARAYKTHGKNACSHIQLRDYFGDFCINPEEYKAIFADSEDMQSSGYCLRADTERNGTAIRIMHSSSSAFRPGAVVRCTGLS